MLGVLDSGTRLIATQDADDSWIIRGENDKASAFIIQQPLFIEIVDSTLEIYRHTAGYQKIKKLKSGFKAFAQLDIPEVCQLLVEDMWTLEKDQLTLKRVLSVIESRDGLGFNSGISGFLTAHATRYNTDVFVPGMIYGGIENISNMAIGGAYVYSEGDGETWIREDRMPAPLYGFYLNDGSSFTMLNEKPDGRTIQEDSHDTTVTILIDERINFGSMGSIFSQDTLMFGYMFPGSEGEITYKGSTYPDAGMAQWRRRFHPLQPGFVHNYQLSFRLGESPDFATYYSDSWRWAWGKLAPEVNFQNIELARESLVHMLGENIEVHDNRFGISNWISAAAAAPPISDRKCVLGFCGKALETAEHLIYGSYDGESKLNQLHYKQGIGIIHSFVRLTVSPPAGEGFNLDTGDPVIAIPAHQCVYLRSYGDGMKALARTCLAELERGISHQDWEEWMVQFADWLLSNQYANGGFPRSWKPGTGEIDVAAAQSSYNAIPFLSLLTEISGKERYLQAAIRAGEFCWNSGQSEGVFVGGTIDNPNVIDKEAGTLSLEAYLALYSSTDNPAWLERARMAANFSETWIYAWNVPMPQGESDSVLHWKQGVPSVGMQLISTGHSLTDCYMAFDTDEFASLSLITSDSHYLEVAKILLHNTKGMMALPERLYDLKGPGWMQEHWSLSMDRGYGFHRGWLPWVSTSNLNGIYGLKQFDEELYQEMIKN